MSRSKRFDIFGGSSKHHVAKSLWLGAKEYAMQAISAERSAPSTKLDDVFKCPKSEQLRDGDLMKWLRVDETLGSAQSPDPKHAKQTIRVLICQTSKAVDNKICYHMEKDSYLAVEEAFQLPSRTLTSSSDLWSTQACQFVPVVDKDGREGVILHIIIKTTNIPGLAHSALSLTYDFSCGQTNAFAYGSDAINPSGSPKDYRSLSRKFWSDLNRTMTLWRHPLLLPVILLKQELAMIRRISRDELSSDNEDIWGKPFSSSDDPINSLLVGIGVAKDSDAEKVDPLKHLNALICSSINIRLAVQTARKCATFLLGVLDSMADLRLEFAPPQQQRMMNQQIKDIINCLDNEASRLEAGNDGILAMMQVQLTAASTYASQLDNVRSAHLAAQSGLDAVAMKILAVVAAVFLPATFVATLFSMTMFDWQANAEAASPSVVSGDFWIYWFVTVPLTVVVLGLCIVSWRRSCRTYLLKVRDANTMAALFDNLNEEPLHGQFQALTKGLGKRSWHRNHKTRERDTFNLP